MAVSRDVHILRELAKRYAGIAEQAIQDERRDLWRKHNSLQRTRPPLYVRWLSAWPEVPESRLECDDLFYQGHETFLRQMLFQDTIGDDYVIEPWITQEATYITPPEGVWGPKIGRILSPDAGGSWKFDPPLKRLEDMALMVAPHHVIDQEDTARNVERLQEALGDILEVNVERAPLYRMWHADISTDLAYLRGLEQMMWDMTDNPTWLHRLVGFMRDGILTAHQEAEAAGDWRLCAHQNQAMAYAEELEDPRADGPSVTRDQLWVFAASQETTLVSPPMWNEFILQYQKPIMEAFGLSAYGCCEDLTRKIPYLRQIRNLRRIAVPPVANVRQCAEQIGTDYVLSLRPSPAEMVCCGFDPEHVRRATRQAMEDAEGCYVDITLKDVQTIQHQPERLREWVRITREVADEYA